MRKFLYWLASKLKYTDVLDTTTMTRPSRIGRCEMASVIDVLKLLRLAGVIQEEIGECKAHGDGVC